MTERTMIICPPASPPTRTTHRDHTRVLAPGKNHWHPDSTDPKQVVWGPATVTYNHHDDGSITATVIT